MVRDYKRKPGAAKQLNIPKRTIFYKLKQKHFKRPGKQCVFSRDKVESLFHILKL